MTDITNFQLADAATYTTGASSLTEVTGGAWTVAWEDLTAAGFANGDRVIIIARFWQSTTSSSQRSQVELKIGTSTFAAATTEETFVIEGLNATASLGGHEQGYLDERILATDQNFYWGHFQSGAVSSVVSDFSIIFLKTHELELNTDYYYKETESWSGDAPATATTAETITLPVGGGDDWLLVGNLHWLVDGTSQLSNGRLTQNASGTMVNKFIGSDGTERIGMMMIGYVDTAVASEVELLEYWDAGSNDLERSAFFALNMSLFASHNGEHDLTAVTRDGTLDTFKETHEVVLNLATTGKVAWFSQTIADVTATDQIPVHKVELDGTELEAGMGLQGTRANGTNEEVACTSFGIEPSVTSGATKSFKNYSAEDNSVTTSYDLDRHVLVMFSMELAGGAGGSVTIEVPPGGTPY